MLNGKNNLNSGNVSNNTPGGGSGSGDVNGPASSTNNALARFSGTSGKQIKNSPVIVDDSGNASGFGNISQNGNKTFLGTARRILADFSNATRSLRLMFKTSTTNGNTRVGIIPDGTAQVAGVDVYSSSDPDNSSFLQVHADGSGSHVGLNSSKTGTETTRDLVFQIDGVTKAKVNASDGKFNVDTINPSQIVATDSSKNLVPATATIFGAFSNGFDAKATPVDADSINIVDSEASNASKKVTWTNVKATLKTYFDSLYQTIITSTTNFAANIIAQRETTIVTADGTTTLTSASTPIQTFTGSSDQTVVLPDARTLQVGAAFVINKQGLSGIVTINNNGGTAITASSPGASYFTVRLLDNSTANGVWSINNRNAGTNVIAYTTPGTYSYTPSPGIRTIRVYMYGGGGGGGGGARISSANSCSGGGGGGGGAKAFGEFDVSTITFPISITVGQGGTGGLGATTNGTAGSNGTNGTASTFGTLLRAGGGGFGLGGQIGVNSNGGGGASDAFVAGDGSGNSGANFVANGSSGGNGGFNGSPNNNFGCSGGGSNGTTGVAGNGGFYAGTICGGGAGAGLPVGAVTGLSGGAAGFNNWNNAGTAGTAGNNATSATAPTIATRGFWGLAGTGGAGGGSSPTVGGNGGNAFFGGGGGGGGSCQNGGTAGNGGNGGNGLVIIVET